MEINANLEVIHAVKWVNNWQISIWNQNFLNTLYVILVSSSKVDEC